MQQQRNRTATAHLEPTQPMAAPAGSVDARYAGGGRYELVEQVGTGSAGTVHAAYDHQQDRLVALKRTHAVRREETAARDRARAEAAFLTALEHPALPRIHDHGEDHTGETVTPYVAMRLVTGDSLLDVLEERGRLGTGEALRLIADVADALAAVHEAGIVHRDVKPGNLVVQPGGRPVLVDFGIAAVAGEAGLTEGGEILGTMDYISPEQVTGAPATPASDVYSLGVVAHRCLTGRRAYDRPTPMAAALAHLREPAPDFDVALPPPVRTLLTRMLAKDPAERPSAAEVAAMVGRHRAD